MSGERLQDHWSSDLKEALKTEHFLNVFRPRIRSEYFPKRQSSNLNEVMNV